MKRFLVASVVRILPTCVLLFSMQSSRAGSATWNLNPTSADWNTAANWTPNTVPDGQADIATFSLSNRPAPSLSAPVELSEIIFAPGASAFTINFMRGRTMNIYGAGITNNSGIPQTFVLTLFRGVSAQMVFHNSATAGDGIVYTVESPYPIPGLFFLDNSSAGTSTLVNNGTSDVYGSFIDFTDSSTAAEATIINNGGIFSGGQGGLTILGPSSTAGNATIFAHGGRVIGALGGSVSFAGAPQGGDATVIADGGVEGAEGGVIAFFGVVTLDRARVELFDSGSLIMVPGSIGSIGSLEGNGAVSLGANNLTIGGNNLNTTFAGIIQDTGSVTKTGNGKLTLSGNNPYTGGTTVTAGTLFVTNRGGSGTGSGAVQVNAGKLGGTGKISGSVTVGTGSGPGAFLTPGTAANRPAILTIRNTLTFKADGTFHCGYKSTNTTADKAVARGVTIGTGAQLFFGPVDSGALALGTVFTAIDNTATTPIAGNFANIIDGSTITVGANTFQANYEGGDGNDLTLTVVP